MASTVHDEQKVIDAIDALVALFLVIPSALFSAFVAWKLWGWFAVGAGLPALSYGVVGCGYILYWFVTTTPTLAKSKPDKDASLTKHTLMVFAHRAMALGFGYLFHTWGA